MRRYLIFLYLLILPACEELEDVLCHSPLGLLTECDTPSALNVHITGTAKVTELLTGNYTYSDPQGDLEGRTTFRWSRGNNKGQSVFITDATKQTYTLTPDDVGFWIFFRVVPRAKTGPEGGNIFFASKGVGPVSWR